MPDPSRHNEPIDSAYLAGDPTAAPPAEQRDQPQGESAARRLAHRVELPSRRWLELASEGQC